MENAMNNTITIVLILVITVLYICGIWWVESLGEGKK